MSRIISVLPKTVFDFILTDYRKQKIQNSYYEHNHYFRFSIPSRYARWWSKSKHECFWPFLKNVKNGNDRRREKQDTGHIFQSYWNDDRRRLFSATSSYIWLTADDGFYQKQPIFFDTSVWIGGGWWEETRLNDRFHIFFLLREMARARGQLCKNMTATDRCLTNDCKTPWCPFARISIK